MYSKLELSSFKIFKNNTKCIYRRMSQLLFPQNKSKIFSEKPIKIMKQFIFK